MIQSISAKKGGSVSVCDVGCGKGRYLKRLAIECPGNDYYASDISEQVMAEIGDVTEKNVGSMTCINYKDSSFDIVYACESFEHAINLRGAFNELYRITKPNGMVIILDKPIDKLGQLDIYEWEQWVDDEKIKELTNECGGSLEVIRSVPYENKDDGLFRAWVIKK